MDSDGLPLIGAGIDFTKVEPIPNKQSLTCINHFIMHTVSFLNRFSCVCEEKLEDLATRIHGLETTMNILEAKIASIPGLDAVTITTSTQLQPQQPNTAVAPQNTAPQVEVNSVSSANAGANSGATVNGLPSSDSIPNGDTSAPQGATSAANDPRYAKFFTLIKHGVPKEAVAPKMLLEGLDPAVLDNPSAPVAPPTSNLTPAKLELKNESEENKNDSDLSDSDNQSDSLSDSKSSDSEFDD